MEIRSKRTRIKAGEGVVTRGLSGLPSVDRVLNSDKIAEATVGLSHDIVANAVRAELESARETLRTYGGEAPDIEQIAARAAERAWATVATSLKPVINATGVVIHTNLGRAPLSRSAISAMQHAAVYSNLEFDLESGVRGSRYAHAVDILRRVTGCESALVVNNNAAALVLVLSALARSKEVIVSRGQLVEIGGGFRIPEIMSQSGANLVEVGTTNRTYASDYARAITDETALLMRIHSSNFRITGFTTSPTVEEIATLAHEKGFFMVDDIGSGALLDTTRYGLSAEPTVQASLKADADLVMFSGDKLLGGPQCGIIVGKWAIIETLTRQPLARALRVDKITLSALEATLVHYLKGEAEREIPAWQMISATPDALKKKSEKWAAQLSEMGIRCNVIPGESAIGGGSLPDETLPTWFVQITPGGDSSEDAGRLAHALRKAPIPVVARLEHGALLLDPRTVLSGQDEILLSEIVDCFTATSRNAST